MCFPVGPKESATGLVACGAACGALKIRQAAMPARLRRQDILCKLFTLAILPTSFPPNWSATMEIIAWKEGMSMP
jgi:hypothetical protein